MSTMSTEETDDSQERFLQESSPTPHVAEREGPRGELSSSSSDGSNDQDHTHVQSFSLQGTIHQGESENGAASTPHSQQAGIVINSSSAGTSIHFLPNVDSSEQDIQSLNPEEDMSFIQRIRSSVSSANGNGVIIRNQFSVPSHFAEHLNPSQTIEMVNHGPVFPINQPMRNFGNSSLGIFNTYHLPISNLPPEFRLESSSRLQLPQSQQEDSQTIPETGDAGLSFQKTQWTNGPPQNQITIHEPSTATGTQEIQFQELLNQVTGSSSFYPNTGTSSHIQVPIMPLQQGISPFDAGLSLPIHLEGLSAINQNRREMQGNFVNSSHFEVGESSLRSLKMKMPWQDNNNISSSPNLQLASWLSPAQGSLSQNDISPAQNSRPLRNTVYDPLYEEMGLPVDPHLRIFVGRRENGSMEEQ